MPRVLPFTSKSNLNAAMGIAWDAADRDTLFKAGLWQLVTKTSGIKICAFLANAKLFLTLCSHTYERWGFFVFAWLGVRRLHVADTIAL